MGMNIDYSGEFTFADEDSMERAIREAAEYLESARESGGGSLLDVGDFERDRLSLRIRRGSSGPGGWAETVDSMLLILALYALDGGIEWDDGDYSETILPTTQYRRRVVVQLHQHLPHKVRTLDDFCRDLEDNLSEKHSVYEPVYDQITINTTDPAGAIDELRPIIEKHALSDLAVIAYRDPGSTEYCVVWPEDYNHGFCVMAGGTFDEAEQHMENYCKVRKKWWHEFWLPFAEDGGGNLYCLDLDPADDGDYGQVIPWERDAGGCHPVAVSFLAFVRHFRDELHSGKYAYDEDEGLIDA